MDERREAGSAPGGRRHRSTNWQLVSAIVLVGGLPIVGTSWVSLLRRPGGDPGGAILQELRRGADATVPPGAAVLGAQRTEAQWDSCNGAPGTSGWDPVRVYEMFTTQASPAPVVARADDTLTRQHWRRIGLRLAPGHDGDAWSRALPNGLTAHLQMTNDAATLPPGGWMVSAVSPAEGPVVGTCAAFPSLSSWSRALTSGPTLGTSPWPIRLPAGRPVSPPARG